MPPPVNVSLAEWSINLDQATAFTGETVHFVIANTGEADHQVRFFQGRNIVAETDILGPGSTLDWEVTFPQAGTWRVTCPLKTEDGQSHFTIGMVATIEVQDRGEPSAV